MNPARLSGVLALAVLALGTVLFIAGSNAGRHGSTLQSLDVIALSPNSQYVRKLDNQPVGSDWHALRKAQQILALAGQAQDARQLERFFRYCNVQRFLENHACENQTIGFAIHSADALHDRVPAPADGDLESRLSAALSFSLAGESLLRQGADEPAWRELHFEGPGLVRADRPHDGNYVFVAIRNQGPWDLGGFEALLTLPAPDSATLELRCSFENRPPFHKVHELPPGAEGIAYCAAPNNTKMETVAAAVQGARAGGPLSVRIDVVEIRNPAVRIDRDRRDSQRFILEAADAPYPEEPAATVRSVREEIAAEIGRLDCEDTATCSGVVDTVSVGLFGLFSHRLWSIPIAVGMLLGASVGGLFARPFRPAAILVAGLLALAVAGLVLLVHTLMMAWGEGVGAAVLGLVAVFPLFGETLALLLTAFATGFALVMLLRRAQRSPRS